MGIFLSVPCFSNALNEDSLRAVSAEDLMIYGALDDFGHPKPDFDVFERAMRGYRLLHSKHSLSDKNILTIIDFRKPSTEKRLWVIDLQRKEIVCHTLVAHGRNSGENYADRFSNKRESHQSSLGFYVTGETYIGQHGVSLKLHGMEKGFNDLAEKRAIVIHPADYVNEKYIRRNGRLGRSHGCPAIGMDVAKDLIEVMKAKTCLFIYYPDPEYLRASEFEKQFSSNALVASGDGAIGYSSVLP
jgi:hypothetical protein